MTLDGACPTLTLAGTGDRYDISNIKNVGRNGFADFHIFINLSNTEFTYYLWLDLSSLEVTSLGLTHALSLFESELDGRIAINLVGLHLRNHAGTSGKQGDSLNHTVFSDSACHANLSCN